MEHNHVQLLDFQMVQGGPKSRSSVINGVTWGFMAEKYHGFHWGEITLLIEVIYNPISNMVIYSPTLCMIYTYQNLLGKVLGFSPLIQDRQVRRVRTHIIVIGYLRSRTGQGFGGFFQDSCQPIVNCWFGLLVWNPRIPF